MIAASDRCSADRYRVQKKKSECRRVVAVAFV
jgi:hypothetical protein